MDYRNTKKYRINTEYPNIGDTLFIVEGSVTEFKILEYVFTKKLDYQLVKKVRKDNRFILKGKNSSKRIFAFNYSKNQLHKIDELKSELDSLYSELRNTYSFNPSDAAVYLIYDRDVECYEPHNVDIKNDYIMKFNDSTSNVGTGYDGLLILSYPCVESYLTSCFYKDAYNYEFRLKNDINLFNNNKNTKIIKWGNIFYPKNNIPKDRMIIAAEEMDKALAYFNIDTYDIDDFYKTNIKAFDAEEENYNRTGKFRALSLLSIVFMQLGIIEEVSDFDPSETRRKD